MSREASSCSAARRGARGNEALPRRAANGADLDRVAPVEEAWAARAEDRCSRRRAP
ncbi:Hypothetical protein A7982_03410 [Minicystis rosea]|nr:Hypothetical protein A7982_03410 [Minicystis rosea]